MVIISAEDDAGVIRNACHLGAIDYIRRPFDAFMVCHRVEQVRQREKTNRMLVNILGRVVAVNNREIMKPHTVGGEPPTVMAHELSICAQALLRKKPGKNSIYA